MKKRVWKCMLSILAAVCMIVGIVQMPGNIITVQADTEEGSEGAPAPQSTASVFYVNGRVAESGDGTVPDSAFKTLSEAYAKVNEVNTEDDDTATIVVCGPITIPGDTGLIYKEDKNAYLLPEHKGTVTITSKHGEQDYTANALITWNGTYNGKALSHYGIQGATRLENLTSADECKGNFYGNYYSLELGEGLGNLFKNVYLGTRGTVFYSTPQTKDISFTMKSGTITNLYGGSNCSSGWLGNTRNGYDKDIVINIDGGKIDNLYGSGIAKTVGQSQHKSITINVGNGTISSLYGNDATATVHGDITINVSGGTIGALCGTSAIQEKTGVSGNVEIAVSGGTVTNLTAGVEGCLVTGARILSYRNISGGSIPAATTNFSELNLTNSEITVSDSTVFSQFTKVSMTDNSVLTLGFAPTETENKIPVKLTQSGDSWNEGSILLKAAEGAADIFSLSEPIGYKLVFADNQWKLAEDKIEIQPEENVFYVNGSVAESGDGTVPDKAFKTLSEAYAKVNEVNTEDADTATIVVCGALTIPEDTGLAYNANKKAYLLPEHKGTVTITSKHGEQDYTANALITWEGTHDEITYNCFGIQGATKLEYLASVNECSGTFYANYYPLEFGEGLGKLFKTVYLGTRATVFYSTPQTKDISFTMKSGNITNLYGGSNGWLGSTKNGYDKSITININGGEISKLYGSGTGKVGELQHNEITINVSNGSITNLYGDTGNATVHGDITINVSGGTIGALCGTSAVQGTEAGVSGNVEVSVAGGTITSLTAGVDDCKVTGSRILSYNGASGSIIPDDAKNFTELKLTSSTVTAQGNTVFNQINKLSMTDDSVLNLSFIPGATEKKTVYVMKSGDTWQVDKVLIQAPTGAADIFNLVSPLDKALEFNNENGEWKLIESEIRIGQKGTKGTAMNVELGLPDADNFTPLDDNATVYDTYLQKRADLEEAGVDDGANVIQPIAVTGEYELYVALDGDDTNSGSKDKPFATINKALEYVEALQNYGVDGIVVYLREGTYLVNEPITLNEAHSGKNGIPVIISAYPGETVSFTGAVNIAGSKATAVSDESIINRLPEAARDKVVEIDLAAEGITYFGAIDDSGPGYHVYVDGEELTLARYPDGKNLALLGEVLDIGPITQHHSEWPYGTNSSSTGVEFEMTDFRPTTWYNDGNIWIGGSLYAEWAKNCVKVAEIRTETGTIKTDGGNKLGAKTSASNKYYYFNVLEELNVPGEFYLDTATGKLYIYPIGEMANATVTFAAHDGNFFELNNTSNVVLNGLNLEYCSNIAVNMSNVYQTVVQNCVVKNVKDGFWITGKKSGVVYSEITCTTEQAVRFDNILDTFDYSGNYNFVQNCKIYNTGTGGVTGGYIRVNGGRIVISHNLFQAFFKSCIYLDYAKECIVEYNEIVGGPIDSYDMAAIYQPYRITSTGNHIRYNYFHDIGLYSDAHNPSGVYLDEGMMGDYVYGNIMSNIPCGIYTNSGCENVFADNVIINGSVGSKAAIRSEDNKKNVSIAERDGKYEAFFALDEAERLKVQQRFPALVRFYNDMKSYVDAGNSDYVGYHVCHENYVLNNLFYNINPLNMLGRDHIIENNITLTENPFVNVANHDFTINTEVLPGGFEMADMSQIGILAGEEGISSFMAYAPYDGITDMDPYAVFLKWTLAEGSDTYQLKIATNAELTENVLTIEEIVAEYLLFDADEYFDFDTTYYWQVTAESTAKGRETTPKQTAVCSFKTMTQEKYDELNPPQPIDFTEHKAVIAEAEQFAETMTEMSEGGLYENGSKETLRQAIETAKALMEEENIPKYQIDLNKGTNALSEAILAAKISRAVQYVTFEEMNEEDWVDSINSRGDIAVVDGELQLSYTGTGTKDTSTEIVSVNPVGIRDILCFKFKLDELNEWNGPAIAQRDTSIKCSSKATDSYFICIKNDLIELQKRSGGKTYPFIEVENTGIIEPGKMYDIELAAINNPDGSVQVIFKVDGEYVFNYTDTENPVVGSEGFGIVVQQKNEKTYIQKADLSQFAVSADVTALSEAISEAEAISGEKYTTDSYNALQTAITVAKDIAQAVDCNTIQSQIDVAVSNLKAAVDGLKEKGAEPTLPTTPEESESTPTPEESEPTPTPEGPTPTPTPTPSEEEVSDDNEQVEDTGSVESTPISDQEAGSMSPNTGDNSHIAIWILLLAATTVVIWGVGYIRSRKKNY